MLVVLLLLAGACTTAAPPDGLVPAFEHTGETADSGEDTADDSGGRPDMDGDGFGDGDCAETDPAVYPGAPEVCNGVDDDCDGSIDQNAIDAALWFADVDDDDYGDESVTASACRPPSGFTGLGGDCNDLDAAVNPEAVEWCDGQDDNCSGGEDDAEDAWLAYEDGDADGFGFLPRRVCDATGLVSSGTDCDDGDPAVHPGAIELCDGVDDDCDAEVDEDATDARMFYLDADGDTLGDADSPTVACAAPADHVADDCDCDDADAAVGGPVAWYEDLDDDGYGSTSTLACDEPAGFGTLGGDCDDGDSTIWPGAPETCDSAVDRNCDGCVGAGDADGDGLAACADCDDADASTAGPTAIFADRDGDGYGDATSSMLACGSGAGFVLDDTDCNDTSGVSHPGAAEVWYDGEDEDCAGGDDWDQDLDGYSANVDDCDDTESSVNPAGTEACGNHMDDDCDGTDNGCSASGTESLASADIVMRPGVDGAFFGTAMMGVPDPDDSTNSLIVVGASGVDHGTGAVYIGTPSALALDTTASTWRATWLGVAVGEHAGAALSRPADLDGDGSPDLLVGGYVGEAAWVIPLSTTGTNSLSAASGALYSSDSEWFGWDVLAVPDVNGDGVDEFVVSAPFASTAPLETGRGCAYFFTGPMPSSKAARAGSFCGDANAQYWGVSIDVGDLSGDGGPELVSTSWVAAGEVSGSGKVALIELPIGGPLDVSAADAFVLGVSASDPINDAFVVGDLNGDGYLELAVGLPGTSDVAELAGSVRVFLGPISGEPTVDDADFVLWGTRERDGVDNPTGAGDVDADGFDDLLVPADAASSVLAGRVALFYGPLSGSATLDDAGALFEGEEAGDNAGNVVAGPGDLNGDGFDDVLIGAPDFGAGYEGAGYVWYGWGG